MISSRTFRLLLLIFFSLTLLIVAGCSKEAKPAATRKGGLKFPVEIATVGSRAGDLAIHAVGSVEAFEIVQVTARVSGAVQKVHFKEGETVRESDPLVEIEPERFALATKSAEAVLAKAKASLREAQAGLSRRIDIQTKNPGFVSSEEMDTWQTQALSAEADSAKAAADLDVARLNERDAHVPAPVSGIIQSRSIRTGDFVQLGTLMATLVRRDPLLLKFDVPDQDAQRLRNGLDVTFTVRGESQEYHATITAITESADPVTRMIAVTAEITDPKKAELRPGAFAEATVLFGGSQDLPVVPQISIRPSEKGFLAYVVQDSTAKERILTLGLQSPDGYVEVKEGLRDGEKLVIRGAEALTDGAAVRVISPNDSTSSKSKRGKKA